MKKPIYFDYAATTPCDPRVAQKIQECLTIDGCFGNPASRTHYYGRVASEKVELAREQVADLINAKPSEIIWTSGATESDNLAIQGAAFFYQSKGKHIITSCTEHKAVLDTCKYLQSQHGFEVTCLKPKSNGIIDIEDFVAAIRPDTILASIMHVNNEIGVIQDIASMGKICRERGILFHVDAAQSAGKLAIDTQSLDVDLMSFSGHKIYAPKGIGALYVRNKPKARLHALIYGGGHENGLRSGTLATHQIVGMGEAFAIAKSEMHTEHERLLKLRNKLWNGIKDIPCLHLNGDFEQRYVGNLNFCVQYVEGQALLMALAKLAISNGSACTSANVEGSFVLKGLGLSDIDAHSSIRLALGRFTTEDEVDVAIEEIHKGIAWLRSISPLWDKHSVRV